jgi:hypothetical protein
MDNQANKMKKTNPYPTQPRYHPFHECGQTQYQTILLHKWTIYQHPSNYQKTHCQYKNINTFHPVGTSKKGMFNLLATRSRALEVGMLRATPCTPCLAKYGMERALAAITTQIRNKSYPPPNQKDSQSYHDQ